MEKGTIIVLESPYSGNIATHVQYAQRAMLDARKRGEIVLVPHLLWTQHHLCPTVFVSDYDEKYDVKGCGRDESLEQIRTLRGVADKVVFYMDYGMSPGMRAGREDCLAHKYTMEERYIGCIDAVTLARIYKKANE
jgi:hypothetical protein